MGKTLIIAEAGVNHNGSLDLALNLVDAAADSGADYVKFQTFKAEKLVTKSAATADYQKKNMGGGDSQYEMLKRLELSEDDHRAIIERCDERGIKFLSTAFDLDSVDFLDSLGTDLWKIPSGEISNYPYLRKIASKNGHVVMSTGMCRMEDISAALAALKENGQSLEKVTLLHCNTEYPTPFEDVNLLAMRQMKDTFGLRVGYSDHTPGIEVPIAATALGATVIEKHFTLDRTLPGPDHRASLEPQELKAMVDAIRNIELALGDGHKAVSPSESKNVAIARKSIVAARPIKEGEILSEDNLDVKRPGTGLSPMRWKEVVGTRAVRDFETDEMIEL